MNAEMPTHEEARQFILGDFWQPSENDLSRAVRNFRENGIYVIQADDEAMIERSCHKLQPICCIAITYCFERPTDMIRARHLTIRAARQARLYPYQWARQPLDAAMLRRLDLEWRASQFYQVWLRELTWK